MKYNVNTQKEKTVMQTFYLANKAIHSHDYDVYSIEQKGKAIAKIVPELGNNCYSFRIADGNTSLNIIDEPPDLETLKQRPTAYGNPILFPFPNRIRDGKWEFEGKTYQFDKTPESPTTIHGLLLNRPYKVDKHEADENGAVLVCSLNSQDFPDVVRQYPFPFVIKMTYLLKDSSLNMHVEIENIGNGNMPVGFGIHPYFNVNPTGLADASKALITVPANKYWELDDVLVPTGERHAVHGILDLRSGQPFEKLKLDHVFTDAQFVGGVSRCLIENKDIGYGMLMESDAVFRELVVYTPPERETICFEPYTCPTDAINLEKRGVPAGVIVLPPQGTFTASVRISAIIPM